MKLICISASNTRHMGKSSASTRVCELAGKIVGDRFATEVAVEVVPLMEYDIKTCTLCGRCLPDGCPGDPGFRQLLAKIRAADGLVLVVPHYAIVPAGLTQVLEKLNQLFYVNWCHDNDYVPPFQGMPVGLIAHGGAPESERSNAHLRDVIITPLSYVLRSLSFNVLSLGDDSESGVTFGTDGPGAIKAVEGKLLPDIEHNWERIRTKIGPLVLRVVEEAQR